MIKALTQGVEISVKTQYMPSHSTPRDGFYFFAYTITIENKKVSKVAIRFVRHNNLNETYFCDPANEGAELGELNARCAKLGTKLVAKGMELEIAGV